MGPGDALVAISLIIGGVVVVLALRGPLGTAIGDRIAGRGRGRGDAGAADDQIERLQGELDDMKHRLTEAEERLDFTERMLARQRQQSAVGPGDLGSRDI
jgi:hypothetical protein